MPSQRRSQMHKSASSQKEAIMPSRKPRPRRRRRDAGKRRWNPRDRFALSWIGQQYGIRLDHLQCVLGRLPGRGAQYTDWISEGAARDVVKRWESEGWVHVAHLQVEGPFWVWLTGKGLRAMGLPYAYRNLHTSKVDDVEHLYAINAIRLDLETDEQGACWTSERTLLHGLVRRKGERLLHRPDGIFVAANGRTVAIEAELSAKKASELDEVLLELLRGEEYLQAKADLGVSLAQTLSRHVRSQYDQIWYFAPKSIRRHVRRARARLLDREVISQEEAERIQVLWYPLALTDEALTQEKREEEEALGLEGDLHAQIIHEHRER